MRYSIAASALVLAATNVFAQENLATVEPSTSAPAGCDRNYNGSFEITVVPISDTAAVARRGLSSNGAVKHLSNMAKRQNTASCMSGGTLVANLNNGVLTDSQSRTGSIVANRQFQFDPEGGQAGAIYTGGFSVCSPSNHLALGDSTVFYQCASGDFYNLYDEAIGEQCSPVYIEVIPCDGSSMGMNGIASGSNAGQIADGQVQNGLNQIADGQLQVPSVNQIADGQVQNGGAGSNGNANQIADGQIQNGGAAANGGNANQIDDGQVQNGGGSDSNVNQIADGQIQGEQQAAPTPVIEQVGQIVDGQLQAKRQEDGTSTEETNGIFTNVAVPKKAKRTFAGVAAAAAGYAAMF